MTGSTQTFPDFPTYLKDVIKRSAGGTPQFYSNGTVAAVFNGYLFFNASYEADVHDRPSPQTAILNKPQSLVISGYMLELSADEAPQYLELQTGKNKFVGVKVKPRDDLAGVVDFFTDIAYRNVAEDEIPEELQKLGFEPQRTQVGAWLISSDLEKQKLDAQKAK